MRNENIYREEGPPPQVIITEKTWHEEEEETESNDQDRPHRINVMTTGGLAIEVSQQEPPVSTQEPLGERKLFADSFNILMLTKTMQGRPIDEIYERQLQEFERQVNKLSLGINEQLIELGMLIIVGGQIGIHRLAGHDTMIEWMTLGLHLSLQIVSMATDRYQVWRYASRFGISLDDLANIEAAQLKILQNMRINVDRQAKHIATRKAIDCIAEQSNDDENLPENIEEMSFEEVMRLVPEEIRPQVRAEAEEEYSAWIAGEIRHVLDSDPAELRNNDARLNGEVVKPTFTLKATFDPLTGYLRYQGLTKMEYQHFLAMQKGQYNLCVVLQSPVSEEIPQGPMNIQTLGHSLESISDSYEEPPPY